MSYLHSQRSLLQAWEIKYHLLRLQLYQRFCPMSAKGQQAFFKQVCWIVPWILVMLSTNASNKRSFSTMKRLKTYLPSTMGQSRLNHLMVLNIYKEILDSKTWYLLQMNFFKQASVGYVYLGFFSIAIVVIMYDSCLSLEISPDQPKFASYTPVVNVTHFMRINCLLVCTFCNLLNTMNGEGSMLQICQNYPHEHQIWLFFFRWGKL